MKKYSLFLTLFMDNQALLAKIGIIVTEIRDHYQVLSENAGILAEPDIEICLATTRLLVEYLEILQKVNRTLPDVPVLLPVLPLTVHVRDPLALPLTGSAVRAEQAPSIHAVLSAANPSPDMLNDADKRLVKHISQGISLNQRLLFIRALFKGSVEGYERTLATLDNFITEAEALDYLDNHIGPEYDWASRENPSHMLKTLLTRRFS